MNHKVLFNVSTSAGERETETVDISPDTQLNEQIMEDTAAAHESNLLTEE